MAEQPPLSRIHVVGYSANDRDFPILNLVLDPRVAGYQVPKDLSACPDKRYPNHVFTGAQPIAGDQRVRHVWEILPSPWVPFTRYDDDLGPVQGRRRSVKNDGQVASLTADKRTTYEAREGSAIVYTELEESWSIKTDGDGNSLFPIRDRDFYDPSRGPVQERRQLFVPTGEEEGSLENVNGVITQTSYEPYNEFLSVKIVQTYKVDGPQLIGNSTNNEGQLVTVTTQRKAADGYVPPSPTATRTVEASREDAESLVERIVDAPEIFNAKTIYVSKEDNIPSKFKAGLITKTEQNILGEPSVDESITIENDEIEKSQQRLTNFTIRETKVSRPKDYEEIDNTRLEETWGISIPYTESIENAVSEEENSETEGIGDGLYLVRKYDAAELDQKLSDFSVVIPTKINVDLPKKLGGINVSYETRKSSGEVEFNASGLSGSFNSLTQRDNGTVSSTLTIIPRFDIRMIDTWGRDLDAEVHIFFLKEDQLTKQIINQKVGATGDWPKFSPQTFSATAFGYSETKSLSASISRALSFTSDGKIGHQPTSESQIDFTQQSYAVPIDIPSCITSGRLISISQTLAGDSRTINLSYPTVVASNGRTFAGPRVTKTLSHSIQLSQSIAIPATPNQTTIPNSGKYVMNPSIEPYKFGWYLVRATVLDASSIG